MRTVLILFNVACVGLALALSACASPPAGKPIVLNRVSSAHARPRAKPPAPCEPVTPAKLSEPQKDSLFEAFDAWRRERRSGDAPAEAALPPPGPLPHATAAASRACRTASP